jgi:hypothetical protein
METNNKIPDQWLNELFKKIPLENLSETFLENLMNKIEKEAIKEKRKNQWTTIGQIAVGIACILLLPGLALYLCSLLFSGFSIPVIHIRFDPMALTVGASVLLLLITDVLVKRKIFFYNRDN